MWKYIGKEGRFTRLKLLASRMFQRHQAVYGALLIAGTYDGKNPTPELIQARYWLAFAQHAVENAGKRHRREIRFSTDVRWRGLAVADEFDRLNRVNKGDKNG